MCRSEALGSCKKSWVRRGWQVVQGEREFGILQEKKVGMVEGVPGPLGFVPCKKRRIVLVLDLR